MSNQYYTVQDVTYHLHTEPSGSTVMEVRYKVGTDRTLSEYLDFEDSFQRIFAAKWWRRRSPDNVPKTNQHAVDSANYHAVAPTLRIKVYYFGGNMGACITAYKLGEKPPSIHETW